MRIQENMIEFSPFSIKGRKALSRLASKMRQCNVSDSEIKKINDEEYFLEKYYIEPFTRVNKQNWLDEIITEDDKDVYDVDVLKKSKKDFEKELADNVIKLVWIHGNSGCGKSTYVHKLGQIYKNEIKMSFYDFEKVGKSCIIKCFEDEKRIGNDTLWSKSNCFRFLILIINKITENLYINSLDDTVCVENLKAIINEYEKYKDSENDFEHVINFFNYLKQAVCPQTRKDGVEGIVSFFMILLTNLKMNKRV